VPQVDKDLIEVVWRIVQFKVKVVQELIVDLEALFALALPIEVAYKIDLEFLSGQLVDPTALIIVQVFHLA
tara:strand:- start:14 stop:226 length:213 start_codon:yes stop_codon:yes gene_type:complete